MRYTYNARANVTLLERGTAPRSKPDQRLGGAGLCCQVSARRRQDGLRTAFGLGRLGGVRPHRRSVVAEAPEGGLEIR